MTFRPSFKILSSANCVTALIIFACFIASFFLLQQVEFLQIDVSIPISSDSEATCSGCIAPECASDVNGNSYSSVFAGESSMLGNCTDEDFNNADNQGWVDLSSDDSDAESKDGVEELEDSEYDKDILKYKLKIDQANAYNLYLKERNETLYRHVLNQSLAMAAGFPPCYNTRSSNSDYKSSDSTSLSDSGSETTNADANSNSEKIPVVSDAQSHLFPQLHPESELVQGELHDQNLRKASTTTMQNIVNMYFKPPSFSPTTENETDGRDAENSSRLSAFDLAECSFQKVGGEGTETANDEPKPKDDIRTPPASPQTLESKQTASVPWDEVPIHDRSTQRQTNVNQSQTILPDDEFCEADRYAGDKGKRPISERYAYRKGTKNRGPDKFPTPANSKAYPVESSSSVSVNEYEDNFSASGMSKQDGTPYISPNKEFCKSLQLRKKRKSPTSLKYDFHKRPSEVQSSPLKKSSTPASVALSSLQSERTGGNCCSKYTLRDLLSRMQTKDVTDNPNAERKGLLSDNDAFKAIKAASSVSLKDAMEDIDNEIDQIRSGFPSTSGTSEFPTVRPDADSVESNTPFCETEPPIKMCKLEKRDSSRSPFQEDTDAQNVPETNEPRQDPESTLVGDKTASESPEGTVTSDSQE